MKKAALGALVFIIALLFSLLWSFPTESVIRYSLWKVEEQTGVAVTFEKGTFLLNKANLSNVDISAKGKHLMNLKEVKGVFWPGSSTVEGVKGDGKVKLDVSQDDLKVNLKNFQLVTEGTKFFKQIAMTGDIVYNTKSRQGTSKGLQVDLKGSLDPFIKTDVLAECDVQTGPRDINITLTRIQGENLTGNGIITIIVDPANFNNSQLSGNLRLNAGGAEVQIKLSGTLSNPSAIPAVGVDDRTLN